MTDAEKIEHLTGALKSVIRMGEEYRYNVSTRLTSDPPQNPGAYYCMTIARNALRDLEPCPVCGERLGTAGAYCFEVDAQRWVHPKCASLSG